MQIFIIASLFFAGVFALPLREGKMEAAPIDIAEVELVQDIFGNYRLMHRDRNVTRVEEGFQDGHVVGSYEYIDYEGVHHTIKFLASKDGYTAEGADIPVQIAETPEVMEARAEHMTTMAKQVALLPKWMPEDEPKVDPKEIMLRFIVPEIRTLPYAPKESEEVMMAKQELLEAHSKALQVMMEEYKKALMI